MKMQKQQDNSWVGDMHVQENLLCFSHLRWDFVYQRPQHLMTRLAKTFRVFFIEEPISDNRSDGYDVKMPEENVMVVVPHLQDTTQSLSLSGRHRLLIDQLLSDFKIQSFIAWYYTPMALKFTNHLKPLSVIYDCMDELSAFKFAPTELKLLEAELFGKADIVFTGGHSLYEAKKHAHSNIFSFPSSIDKPHFAQARKSMPDPADQQKIEGIRLGFYGVIDERFDITIIERVARMRPEWQLVLVGPVVKIKESDLPRLPNIHYLGGKIYQQLPAYLSGWDIAMIPFAKNESTRFISPTKTPEYLAAGKPVISASIADVVEPYGSMGLVSIADTAESFIAAAENILGTDVRQKGKWLKAVDLFLQDMSWDKTVQRMMMHIRHNLVNKDVIINPGKTFKSVA